MSFKKFLRKIKTYPVDVFRLHLSDIEARRFLGSRLKTIFFKDKSLSDFRNGVLKRKETLLYLTGVEKEGVKIHNKYFNDQRI